MIRLECSNCQTVLNIDDAFAGGVCRCQYCGTIQTVPKAGEAPSTTEAPSQKALFKRKARIESALSPYNDQLAKAADEMDSSGHFSASSVGNIGGGSSLASKQSSARAAARQSSVVTPTQTPTATATATPPRGGFVPKPSSSAYTTSAAPANGPATSRRRTMAIVSVSVALAASIGVGAWLFLRTHPDARPDETTISTPSPTTTPTEIPASTTVPSVPEVTTLASGTIPNSNTPGAICDIALKGQTVVYILDRSGCTQEIFQHMANACVKSCESLSASRSFQVILWNSNQELLIPATGPGPAIASNIAACRAALADTYSGTGDITAVMAKALAANPQEIVILSSVDLDEITATDIRKAIEGKTVILHGIAVGNDLVGEQLRLLTTNTQGKFQRVDVATLP